MSYIKHISLFVLVILVSNGIYSQKENKYIRQGTEDYLGSSYGNSEVAYQKALTTNPESFEAKFNLGDAFYKQEKYDEAIKEFSELAGKSTDKIKLGKLYHNIGNSQLNQTKKLLTEQKIDEGIKQISKSIESYKSALKNNPADRETNLIWGMPKN